LKQKLLAALKYTLLFSAGLTLLWLTFRHQNLSEIYEKIKQADPFWLAASLFLAVLAFISRAIRWVILIEPNGIKPKLAPTFYALMIGYFANLAIPRIGEITRCATLAKSEKLSFNILIGTVIVERVIDLFMLFFSMLLVAIFEFDVLGNFLQEKILRPIFSGVHGTKGILTVAAAGILFVIIVALLIRKFGNNALVSKLKKMLLEISAGLKSVLRMKNNGWFLFHTFFIWFIYFLMTYVCFYCLPATSHLDMKAGLFVLVIGGLGMSAPVQGGIGAFHYIVSQGLQLFGVSNTDGIVYATLVHTTQTLLVVFLGTLSLLLMFLSGKKKVQSNQNSTEPAKYEAKLSENGIPKNPELRNSTITKDSIKS